MTGLPNVNKYWHLAEAANGKNSNIKWCITSTDKEVPGVLLGPDNAERSKTPLCVRQKHALKIRSAVYLQKLNQTRSFKRLQETMAELNMTVRRKTMHVKPAKVNIWPSEFILQSDSTWPGVARTQYSNEVSWCNGDILAAKRYPGSPCQRSRALAPFVGHQELYGLQPNR